MAWHLCAPGASDHIYAANVMSPDNLVVMMIWHASGDPGCPPVLSLQGMALLEKKKYTQALALLKKAARLGSVNAALVLGTAHSAGEATRPDPIEAYKWYSVAVARGSVEAGELRDRLEQSGLMTSVDIFEAERRMEAWIVRLPEPKKSRPSLSALNMMGALKQIEQLTAFHEEGRLTEADVAARRSAILDDLRAGKTTANHLVEEWWQGVVEKRALEGFRQSYDACREAGMHPIDCDAEVYLDGWLPVEMACAWVELREDYLDYAEWPWKMRHEAAMCDAHGFVDDMPGE